MWLKYMKNCPFLQTYQFNEAQKDPLLTFLQTCRHYVALEYFDVLILQTYRLNEAQEDSMFTFATNVSPLSGSIMTDHSYPQSRWDGMSVVHDLIPIPELRKSEMLIHIQFFKETFYCEDHRIKKINPAFLALNIRLCYERCRSRSRWQDPLHIYRLLQ
jgi:hypothetical protein